MTKLWVRIKTKLMDPNKFPLKFRCKQCEIEYNRKDKIKEHLRETHANK